MGNWLRAGDKATSDITQKYLCRFLVEEWQKKDLTYVAVNLNLHKHLFFVAWNAKNSYVHFLFLYKVY